MDEFFSRSEALLGAKAMEALRAKKVIIFGVGGVGSWCAEALVRTGLIHLTIVDGDTVQPSNINRQLPATRATMGLPKVEALKARLLEINPEAEIEARKEMVNGEWLMVNGLEGYDYIIDAIDSVNDKTDLIINATRARVKIFSSMGAALRLDPTKVTTGELMDIKGEKVRCVYSSEQAQRCETRGSLMQVTAVFGLTLASLVISDITNQAKL